MPWLAWQPLTQGFAVRCAGCGAQGTVGTAQQVNAFVQQHAAHGPQQRHYAIGDAVAAVTQAVGIKPCEPCKKRQAQLNQLVPRGWPWSRR
jgi:hypothetical protein